jgi:hypothetical protein
MRPVCSVSIGGVFFLRARSRIHLRMLGLYHRRSRRVIIGNDLRR